MTQASSLWEGQIVNNEFHLKKYLGGSDQSRVFLTEYSGQQAAIKLISADAGNLERQLQRLELAKKLSHPHLIRVFQTGRCRLDTTDLIFAVMEYAEENLAQIVPERRLTAEEARQMLDPALEALSFLHGQGYVHGHVKPANIMASGDKLKLSSDCVCKAGEPFPIAGKPGPYDPPEAATDGTSPGADVWSLGMTLTEVLTQRLPRFNEQGIPVLPADIPQPFLDIVRGCLHGGSRSRLTVDDIAAHLHSGKPLLIEKEPARAQEKSSKQRFLVPGMIALAIVLTIMALGLLRRQPPKSEQQPASEGAGRAQQGSISPPVASPTRTKPSPASPRSGAPTATTTSPRPAAPTATTPPATTRSAPAGGEVVHRVLPDVPQSALDTVQGTVRVNVRVQVDRAGNVVGTGLENTGPSKYFARLAEQAARKWKFAPSQNDRREYVLRFEFTNEDVRAAATRVQH